MVGVGDGSQYMGKHISSKEETRMQEIETRWAKAVRWFEYA